METIGREIFSSEQDLKKTELSKVVKISYFIFSYNIIQESRF
jgi:hypothetical protein